MNLKKKLLKSTFIVVILLVLIINVGPLVKKVEADLANTPWPMFHHDLKHTGRSTYLGAQTNYLKWSYTTDNIVRYSPAIGSDGTIYFGSYDGKLYAFNPDGTNKWTYDTFSLITSSPAIGSDGTIYFGSDNKKLYAINPDGSLKWSYLTGNWIESSPAIGSDGTIYIGSDDGKLYAINPNGSLKWSYNTTTDYSVKSSPAIGSDGTIYVGSGDGKFYAINSDGTTKWICTLGNWIYSSPAIGSDGTIYVSSYDYRLYAIKDEVDHGTIKWSYITSGSMYSSPAIGSDGTIYVGSDDGKLYAINPNGRLKWSYTTTTNNWVRSSPAIGSDGTIYVGSNDHKFYAINSEGTLKWLYTTGSLVYSSPAIGSDGTIYVGSDDHKLYAFGTYTITFDTLPPNTGAITFDSVSYSDGDSASKPPNVYNISANPATGYTFTRWETEGDISVENVNSASTKCTVSGNGTLRMVQTINQYTLTVNINPSGSGSVTKNPDQTSYDHGTTVQLTPNPTTGYHFVNWSGDVPSGHENDNPLTITMDSNKTLVANFAINTYTLTVNINPSGSGSVTKNPDQTSYDHGTTVQLTPNPTTGYHFVNWSGDVPFGHESDNPLTITMDSNKTVVANFEINTYTVTFDKNGGDTDPVPSTRTTTYGGTVTLPDTPPTRAGYTFTGYNTKADGTGDPFTSSTLVYSDITVYAQWSQDIYTITFDTLPPNTGAITFDSVSYDSVSYSDGDSASKPPNVYNISANPATGYTFTRWETEGDISVENVNSASTKCTVSGNGTLRMVQTINTYIIKATAGPNGSINPSGDVIVTYGDDQTFNFYPNTGYRISDVLVDGISVGKPNSYTFFNVTTNHTIHVEFEVDSTYFFDTKSGARIYIDLVTPLAPRWRVTIPSKNYDTGWMPFIRYTKTNNHFWGEYADTRYHFIIDFYSSGRYHIIFDDRVTRISIKIAN